jgi:hypothetical protein
VRSACAYLAIPSQPEDPPSLSRLEKRPDPAPPAVAIITLNPQAPGCKAAEESMYTSGIDYNALQLLAACGDAARFTALAKHFSRSVGW